MSSVKVTAFWSATQGLQQYPQAVCAAGMSQLHAGGLQESLCQLICTNAACAATCADLGNFGQTLLRQCSCKLKQRSQYIRHFMQAGSWRILAWQHKHLLDHDYKDLLQLW